MEFSEFGGPPALLHPMLAINDRLRNTARLIVLATVLLVPGLFSAGSFSLAMGGQISFADGEGAGLEVVRPALDALTALAAGDPVDLSGLSAAVSRHPELGLRKAMATVTATETSAASATAVRAQAIVDLITQTGDSSKLILDPDLDSFYSMDLQVVELPKILIAATPSSQAVAANSGLDAEQQRAVTAGRLSATADAIDADIATATQVTPKLSAPLAGMAAAAAAARVLGSSLLAGGQNGAAALKSLTAASTSAIDPAADALAGLLKSRSDRLGGHRDLTLVLTAFGFTLALWFVTATWWRSRHDVGLTVAAVSAIASGDLKFHRLPTGRDEIAEIAGSLESARQLLSAQRDDLQNAHSARERQLQIGYERQRSAELQVRQRAQTIIDETASGVILEMQELITQVDSVRLAASALEERVAVADQVTRSVVDQARAADAGAVNLGQSLRSVADMAYLIRGVADQTKLLALNATIEAARAGKAGRGFSVVADEVKTLAAATARSTQQITATISTLESDASEVAQAITGVGGGIAALDEATVVLRGVARDQFAVVAQLDSALSATIERVGAMATLSERLERRHAGRQAVTGTVDLTFEGQTSTVQLIDLSVTGLRCAPTSHLRLTPGCEVNLKVSAAGAVVEVSAAVVRTVDRDGSGDLGLSFARIDAGTLNTLRRITTD